MTHYKWFEVELGVLAESVSTPFNRSHNKVVLINTSDVFDGKVLNHKQVPNKDLRGQFKKSFKKGDILYSEIRPKNRRFAYVDFNSSEYVASTKLMVLRRCSALVTTTFLYILLTSNEVIDKLQAIAEARSGTFPQITFSELSKIRVMVPPISEQIKIAQTLSCLDEKIELNNRINKVLEEMAQAIFKSWFIDFEPFQDDEFIDSELGPIPKGWEVSTMGKIIEFQKGKKPANLSDKSISRKQNRYITIDMFNGGRPRFADVHKMILADELDTVMVMDGASSGSVHFGQQGIVCSTMAKVKTKDAKLREVVHQLLKSEESLIRLHNTGSAIPHVDKAFVLGLRLPLPPGKVLAEIENVFRRIRTLMVRNNIQSQTIALLRDVLLPKLMLGEIKVPLEGVE